MNDMKSDVASNQVLFMALATQRFPDLARMILEELYHKGVDQGNAPYCLSMWDQMRKISGRWKAKLDELEQEYTVLVMKVHRRAIEGKIAMIRESILLGRILTWHALINHDQCDALTFVCDTPFDNWKVLVVRAMKDTKVVSKMELEFVDIAEIVVARLKMIRPHFQGKIWNPVKSQWTKHEIMSLVTALSSTRPLVGFLNSK